MTTSHHTDGALRFVRRASTLDAPEFAAFAANDNRVPRNAPLPFARGVILAMGFDDEDVPMVSLHLMMMDGEIGVPFHSARHDFDVIALWRGLGRDFNLPLYIRSEQGHLSAVSPDLGEVSFERRIGSALSARRPRFLARRKMPLGPFAAKASRAAKQR